MNLTPYQLLLPMIGLLLALWPACTIVERLQLSGRIRNEVAAALIFCLVLLIPYLVVGYVVFYVWRP